MDPGAVMFAGAIIASIFYAYNPLIGEFMLKYCLMSGTNVKIQLEGNEDFLDQMLKVDISKFGKQPDPIDAMIMAIPEFQVMAWWVGLLYLLKHNEFNPLNPSVITREIAIHVFGFMFFPKGSTIWEHCKTIDIDYTTDEFLENYIFGYKWYKWMEWLL